MSAASSMPKPKWHQRLVPLDYLAIVAGLINVVVIGAIFGYALLD